MMRRIAMLLTLGLGAVAVAKELSPAERGEQALLSRAFSPATISFTAYENAWKLWDSRSGMRPEPYDAAYRERYGLHPAPYPNKGYPMGLRETGALLAA